jgi:hypothetical protein
MDCQVYMPGVRAEIQAGESVRDTSMQKIFKA